MMNKRLLLGTGAAVACAALALSLSSAPGRAAAIDDAAKKEGTVVWYATMNTKDMTLTAN